MILCLSVVTKERETRREISLFDSPTLVVGYSRPMNLADSHYNRRVTILTNGQFVGPAVGIAVTLLVPIDVYFVVVLLSMNDDRRAFVLS